MNSKVGKNQMRINWDNVSLPNNNPLARKRVHRKTDGKVIREPYKLWDKRVHETFLMVFTT